MLTFKQLQDEQRPWVAHNFPGRAAHIPLLGALEELGELAHAHIKAEQGIRVLEDHEANAKDAIGDVIVFLADYCTARGFDLQEIIETVWAQVKQRDWRNDPANGTSALTEGGYSQFHEWRSGTDFLEK